MPLDGRQHFVDADARDAARVVGLGADGEVGAGVVDHDVQFVIIGRTRGGGVGDREQADRRRADGDGDMHGAGVAADEDGEAPDQCGQGFDRQVAGDAAALADAAGDPAR